MRGIRAATSWGEPRGVVRIHTKPGDTLKAVESKAHRHRLPSISQKFWNRIDRVHLGLTQSGKRETREYREGITRGINGRRLHIDLQLTREGSK